MNHSIKKPWLRFPRTDPEILGNMAGVVIGLLIPLQIRFELERGGPATQHDSFEYLFPEHPFWIAIFAVGIAVLSGLFSYFSFQIFLPSCRPRMSDRRKPILFRKMRVVFGCFLAFSAWSSVGVVAGLLGTVFVGMSGVYSELPYQSLLFAMANHLGIGLGGIRALDSGTVRKPAYKGK